MRVGLVALILFAPIPATAQDSPSGKLVAFVTNRYLSEFAPLREDITRLELLNACAAEDLIAPYLDRLITMETNLKRTVISAVDALTEPDLPVGDARRDLTITVLDAFELVDTTTRGTLMDMVSPSPAPVVCSEVRAAVLAQLEAPQPTVSGD
ncbi:MAG: hypothetical protein AAGB10_16685 [Pseudomonadota bacterium]